MVAASTLQRSASLREVRKQVSSELARMSRISRRRLWLRSGSRSWRRFSMGETAMTLLFTTIVALGQGQTSSVAVSLDTVPAPGYTRSVKPILALLLLLTAPAFSQSRRQAPAKPQPPPKAAATLPAPAMTAADLEAFLDGVVPLEISRADIAGAVVAVVKDGNVLLEKGYGY